MYYNHGKTKKNVDGIYCRRGIDNHECLDSSDHIKDHRSFIKMEEQKGLKQEVIANTNQNCLDLQAKIFEYIPKEKHEEFMPLFLAYYHAVGTLNLEYVLQEMSGRKKGLDDG